MTATHTPWSHATRPTAAAIEAELAAEGLAPRWWSNGPYERYAAHEHSYHKVLFCLAGSITFAIKPDGPLFTLSVGDRLDLPPGTAHSASVGPRGCRCVEGWRTT